MLVLCHSLPLYLLFAIASVALAGLGMPQGPYHHYIGLLTVLAYSCYQHIQGLPEGQDNTPP